MNDDLIVFDEEESAPSEDTGNKWEILIVDDDNDVHDATLFALGNMEVFGKKLFFHHAYSAGEAIAFLKNNSQIAVILLDAVMETDNAGLDAVKVIREELGLEEIRIILRTGQPGHIPEQETITRFDINDYKTKSELTRSKLLTTITTALRSWEQLHRIQNSRKGLDKIVRASNQFIAEQGLFSFAEGVISQMAGLFSIEPEGIVCASEICTVPEESAYAHPHELTTCSISNQGYYVIATAGKLSPLMHHNVSEIEDPAISEAITAAMVEKRNQITENGLTVFFQETSGRMYAIYIASRQKIKGIDQELLEIFCTNISLCASNIELVNRLKRQAWQDQVLPVANLPALLEEISRRLQEESASTDLLVLLDIVSFSDINDLLGHEYGNEILMSLVNQIKKRFSGQVYIARLSADTFGLIGSEQTLSQETLTSMMSLGIDTPDGTRDLSLSIGAAHLSPADVPAASHLHNAFFSLKKAKESNQVVYYTEEIGQRIRIRNQRLRQLKTAMFTDEIFLVYQPQLKLSEDRVYSFEALIRWIRPDGEFIGPDQFIPLAEQSGLIIPLGEWILTQALADLKTIHQEGFDDMMMAVNISAIQVNHPGFIDTLDKTIADSGVDPRFLELEITESVSTGAISKLLALLSEIRSRGITLAVDDFGTGYSSLSTIDQWPVDRIKIDRSFVQQMDNRESGARIVDLVIPLGKQLSMNILAEGVEDKEQMDRLKQLDCDEIQGYYLSRPQKLADLISWLKQRG